MNVEKEVKLDIQLIVIAVLILTIVSLSVSYAWFFSIQSQSSIQEMTAGTLNVVVDGNAMSTEEIFPTEATDLPTTENSVVRGSYARLNLSNEGNLDADYSVTIGYDVLPQGKKERDLISFNWLILGIYDEDENKWVKFGDDYYVAISNITPTGNNVYPIFRSVIPAPTAGSTSAKQYRVYIWLSDQTPVNQVGKLVYLKLDVKSTTVNGHVGEGV